MNIEQGLISNDYIDITTIMPNSFNENDIEKLLKSETSIKELIQSSGGELISNTFIISKELQEKIDKKLNKICEEYAEKVKYN
jgi:dephospho-CoA kinase